MLLHLYGAIPTGRPPPPYTLNFPTTSASPSMLSLFFRARSLTSCTADGGTLSVRWSFVARPRAVLFSNKTAKRTVRGYLHDEVLPSILNLKLPDLRGQPLNAVFIFPRKVVDFLDGVVDLLYARAHLVHRIFDFCR